MAATSPARNLQIGAMYMGGGEFSVKEFGVAAESAGFDSVWVGDHLAHYVDGIASVGILAGCTESVTIGTNVVVVPFRPAAVIAKGLLTVSSSAQRRVVLGVGPGGDVDVEFEMAGAESGTRGRYTDEALEVITGLWSGRPFSYDGTWNRFGPVVMEPVVGPRPDIWVGGRSPAALKRAVLQASGYNPYLVSPEQVVRRFEQLRSFAADAETALDGFDFAATTFHVAGRDADDAFGLGFPKCGFGGVSERQYRSCYLLGAESDVLAGVRGYVDAGVNHLIIGCAPGAREQLDSFVQVFSGLLPELKMLTPAVH